MNGHERDTLEARLREDGRRALPDDGFTMRVTDALPPARRPWQWLRAVLVPGAAAIGGISAWFLAPAGTSLVQGFADLARLQSPTPAALGALALALAMAVTAAVLAAEEN